MAVRIVITVVHVFARNQLGDSFRCRTYLSLEKAVSRVRKRVADRDVAVHTLIQVTLLPPVTVRRRAGETAQPRYRLRPDRFVQQVVLKERVGGSVLLGLNTLTSRVIVSLCVVHSTTESRVTDRTCPRPARRLT